MTMREEISALVFPLPSASEIPDGDSLQRLLERITARNLGISDVLAIIDRRQAKAFGDLAMPSEERPARETMRSRSILQSSSCDGKKPFEVCDFYIIAAAIVESIDANTAAIREAKR